MAINSVALVGRVTKDIELRQTGSGNSFVTFTLAVSRNGSRDSQPNADFIQCQAWNRTAELIDQYVHKGSLIGVEGKIQTRNYEDKTGRRVYITEVIANSVSFMDTKDSRQEPAQSAYQTYKNYSHDDEYTTADISNDDLPF